MDVGNLLLELGAVVLALAVLAPLATRAGVSPIPVYLIIGLSLGEGGVYELGASEAFVETGAQIGVVLLLLMLGLEYSPAELIGSARGNLPAGIADLVLNATPGMLAGLLLGLSHLRQWRLPASRTSRRHRLSPSCSVTWAAWPTGRLLPSCPFWCSKTSRWRSTFPFSVRYWWASP